ncbi:magnesium/cobalt transporter CorA [Desertihabitans aurantiacus]|uniref:magnesium/cobalt transporter CorA n=1 Tax=Desertihabitans aurantiacus TaxID=2282477 RepID=UPI0018E59E06|nr:magnesium/cobalt transporter CorA [Desertihabitans aurantiacus]
MSSPARTPRVRQPAAAPATGPGHTLDRVVAWGWYVDGRLQDCADLAEATAQAQQGHGFVWLGLHDPSDADMQTFAEQFDLHPLAIEDAVEGHTRSKVEQFGDTVFVVASTVRYVDHEGDMTASSELVNTGQIMVFCGQHFVMTVRKGGHGHLGDLRRRVNTDPGLLQHGPTSVLYGVLDLVIDTYLDVVAAIEEDVDEVEEAVFSPDSHDDANRTYRLKRELIEFKRAVVPLGAALQALATREELALPPESRAYFRELADHHAQAKESILSFDEVLTSILQFAQARASTVDNQDMRRLSAWVAMVAVPTLIAGVYGMNFTFMPELGWRYGYPMALALMVGSVLALAAYFKRKRWL